MKKYLAIFIVFITTTSYNESKQKLSPSEERILIQKRFDNTEKEIERINKILDNPYRLYEIKNK
jgi:hypothetical protein